MSYIDERCTCCGQRKPEEPKRSRPKVEKLLPYPQDVTVLRERCSFCGAESASSVNAGAKRFYYCSECALDVMMTYMAFRSLPDPVERSTKLEAAVIELRAGRQQSQLGRMVRSQKKDENQEKKG